MENNIQQIIEKVEKEIKGIFSEEKSGHDIYHLRRTLNLALHLQEKEGGDKLVIALAAFVHDMHRVIQNETGQYCSPKESLPKIREILEKVGIEEDMIKKVLHCVEFHEEYTFVEHGKTVKDIETLIVQDADNLDALGAVGVARVFAFGGAHSTPIWVPEIPLKSDDWNEKKRPNVSQIHHFYNKLLKLKDNMNTKTAKKMAEYRHKYLESFLEEFFKEWEGER